MQQCYERQRAWRVSHYEVEFLLPPTESSDLFSLFLKCKHTAGSGSGGVAHNCNSKDGEKSQQLAINLKAMLGELQERKEDFEKLKQKLERLEVSCDANMGAGRRIDLIFFSLL